MVNRLEAFIIYDRKRILGSVIAAMINEHSAQCIIVEVVSHLWKYRGGTRE